MGKGSRRIALEALVAATLALASGCGGGGGGSTAVGPPAPPAPVVASYATTGYMNFTVPLATQPAVAPDGSVVITGDQVRKLDPQGVPVAALGANGQAAVTSSHPVLDPGGNVYYLGNDATSHPRGIYAIDVEGRPLVAFGTNGLAALTSLGGDGRISDSLSTLVRDANGNLFVGGTRYIGFVGFRLAVVVKFDRNGRLDATYGNAGFATVPVEAFRTTVNALAVDAGGNVFVAGGAEDNAGNSRGFVAKLDATGHLATNFGTREGAWVDFICAGFGTLNAIALDAAGNVIVGGACGTALPQNASLYKLDAAGNVVTAFRDAGSRGALFGSPNEYPISIVAQLVLGANGDIYAGGTAIPASMCGRGVIAKLDSLGNPVAAFGENGIWTLREGANSLVGFGIDGQTKLYAVDSIQDCPLKSPPVFTYRVYRIAG